MARWLLLFYLLLETVAAFRVITFTTHLYNEEGVENKLRKVAEVLHTLNPDVALLQEIKSDEQFKELLDHLPAGWSGVRHCGGSKTAIVTNHTILPHGYAQTTEGMHVLVQKEGRQVSLWSVQLPPAGYGPHRAQDENDTSYSPEKEKRILDGEWMENYTDKRSRMSAMNDLLSLPAFKEQIWKSDRIPVIVAGAFNSPSDQDWTDVNRANHFGMTVDWPVPKMLRSRAMMFDSYREVHPDPVAMPGYTWSTIVKKRVGKPDLPEPQDRVNYIFYRGPLKAINSTTYAGGPGAILEPEGKEKHNTWPSDDYAVITDFVELPLCDCGSYVDVRMADASLPENCGKIYKSPAV